jgi:hypothetical protein
MKKLFLIILFFSFSLIAAAQTSAEILNNLPKDEFKIREIATALYQRQEFDLAAEVFLKGRKILKNDQLFNFDLLALYRYRKDKERLIEEYLRTLVTMPEMLQQAQAAFSMVFDNNADYQLLQAALYKRIQKDPQNEAFAQLLTWQYIQQQEYEMALRQLIAQDKRIKDDGGILFGYTQIFISNKAFETAVKAYTYLLQKGKENEYYLPSRFGMIDAQYQLLEAVKNDEKEIRGLTARYQAVLDEYGKNAKTLFAIRKLAALQAQYLHQPLQAIVLLQDALKMPGIPASETGEIKLELGDNYVLTGKPWEAILLYGQVTKEFENQNISNEAQYRTARLSFFQGNFSYAKSQADVLKASTTQLIANDALNLSLLLSDHLESRADTLALMMYAAADFLQYRNLLPDAVRKLDSIGIVYPQNNLSDDILMAKARIAIKKGDFNGAVAQLRQLVTQPQKDIWTDDALFTLAGLYEVQLNDAEQAKIYYQKLITDFPGSMFIAEARKHFRKLRGDHIES